jgi:hypothetical protein
LSQEHLERNGIELYSDPLGGYLFYCPKRKSFSSNGIFDFEDDCFLSSTVSTVNKKNNQVLGRFLPENLSNHLHSGSVHPNMWNNVNFTEKLLVEEKVTRGDFPGSPSSRKRSLTANQKVSASEKIKDLLFQCCSVYEKAKEKDNTWITSASSYSHDTISRSKYLTTVSLACGTMV